MTVMNPNLLYVSADMSSTSWGDATSHEVFTVTGLARMKMWCYCSETVTSSGSCTIEYGTASDTDGFIASTDATTLAAGDIWYDTTPATAFDTFALAVMDYVVYDVDVGYTIGTTKTDNGTLVFGCEWSPLSAGATVVAGDGTAL